MQQFEIETYTLWRHGLLLRQFGFVTMNPTPTDVMLIKIMPETPHDKRKQLRQPEI